MNNERASPGSCGSGQQLVGSTRAQIAAKSWGDGAPTQFRPKLSVNRPKIAE